MANDKYRSPYEAGSEQASELDEHHDDGAYNVDDQPYADEDKYRDEAKRVRRPKLVVAMAMFSLGLAGTAAAFGYRAMSSGALLPVPPPIIKATNQPIKVAPAPNDPHAKSGADASHVDTEATGSIEKLISREEQPVRIEQPKPPRRLAAAAAPAVASAAQRPDQSGAADVAAASNRAHLAATPIAPAEANSAAAVTPPVLGSGYAVQVTSERSEIGAQAAFRALQARYPNQLRGRQPIIRRADLGAGGIYYRALVGPFASAKEAKRLCSGLKAANADCIIQKN